MQLGRASFQIRMLGVAVILTNGSIRNLEQPDPKAAVAIKHGRVVAAGTRDECRAAAPGAREIDLGKRCLTAGLNDAHVHLYQLARSRAMLDASALDLEGLLLALGERQPVNGWVQAYGVDLGLLGAGRPGALAGLDQATGGIPTVIQAHDHHGAWLNSAALRAAGIDEATPDPPGGKIERDSAGQLTGVLVEHAREPLNRVLPGVGDPRGILLEAISHLHSLGITGVHTMSAEPPDALHGLTALAREDRLRLRVWSTIPGQAADAAIAAGIAGGLGDQWLTIGGVKVFSDGALGSRTAWMLEPYEGEPANTGIALAEPEQLAASMRRWAAVGLVTAVHAIGDAANRAVIEAVERAGRPRVRIEHVQCLHADDLPRLAASGAIASIQPCHLIHDSRVVGERWGERVQASYRYRSLIEAGVKVALGTDVPVESADPISNLRAAVTRIGANGLAVNPAEAVSARQALTDYTWGSAQARGAGAWLGRIAPGYAADLTLWATDPVVVAPQEWRIEGAMVGGQWVWGPLMGT